MSKKLTASGSVRKNKRIERDKGFPCPFCTQGEVIPINVSDIEEHLIVTMNNNGDFHVHGPIHDEEMIKKFIMIIAKEAKIEIEDEE